MDGSACAERAAACEIPRDVLGWIEPEVGALLAEFATGKQVLELGTFSGLSTVMLARTAARVVTVDTHDGDEGTRYMVGDACSLVSCMETLDRYGVRDRVTVVVARFEDVLPSLAPGQFDLVFVDGAHDEQSVRSDLEHAQRLVKPGGRIAVHDCNYTSVHMATLGHFGRAADGACESLGWWDIPAPAKRHVVVALPCYDAIVPQALEGLLMCSQTAQRYTVQPSPGSLLGLTFNRVWVTALNTRQEHDWTHFAMHHADIQAPARWLDQLLDEQQASGADVLSAVVPIKDGRGITSTGVMLPEGNIRRLTMREIMELPETFSVHDIPWAPEGSRLMINTGLWVCDFTQPWVEEICGSAGFHILDGIHKDADGVWRARALSEDWHFSRWCHDKGLTVKATRKLAVGHHGKACYWNTGAWGEWSEDKGDNQ